LKDTVKAFLFQGICALFQRPRERDGNASFRLLLIEHFHHCVNGIPVNGLFALQTVNDPDAGVQDTQKVIDLCHRGHCGAGIFSDGLLLDGNGGSDALDAVCIRFFHAFQELAGVC